MKNLRRSNCCQNCAHCAIEHPIDDPTSYYCNVDGWYVQRGDPRTRLLGDDSPQAKAYLEAEAKRARSLISHVVRAGDVCDEFRRRGA